MLANLESDIRNNVVLIHGKGNKERHIPLTPYLKCFCCGICNPSRIPALWKWQSKASHIRI